MFTLNIPWHHMEARMDFSSVLAIFWAQEGGLR